METKNKQSKGSVLFIIIAIIIVLAFLGNCSSCCTSSSKSKSCKVCHKTFTNKKETFKHRGIYMSSQYDGMLEAWNKNATTTINIHRL